MLSRFQQIINYVKASIKSLAPISNAFYDASVMSLAAKDYAKVKFSNSQFSQLAFTLPVSLFSFGQSIGLNYSSTIEGIDETLDALAERQTPEAWVKLSPSQEQLAMLIGLSVTVLVAFGDYCGGDFFISTVPADYDVQADVNPYYWRILCIMTGAVAAVTTAFTEGIDSYKETRDIIAGEYKPPATTLPTKIIGYPLVILAALEAACETYSGIKNTIPYSSTFYLKYILLAPSIAKVMSDFCFPGKLTLNAMDSFINDGIDTITKTREEYENIAQFKAQLWASRAEIMAFTLTFGAAVWVEISQCALTDDLLVDEATKLPFDVPYAMREALGWSATIRDGILQMATLYPLFLYIAEKTLTGKAVVHHHRDNFMTQSLTFWRQKRDYQSLDIDKEMQYIESQPPRYGSTHYKDVT